MSDGTQVRPPLARSGSESDVGHLFAAAETDFARYEVIKDLIDECIDLSLNYRQSGHPGGSRSKVHMMVALLLSGAMRWDLLRPWRRFGDRFVLSAGHTASTGVRFPRRLLSPCPGAIRLGLSSKLDAPAMV